MNILPALAHHLQQQIPGLLATSGEDNILRLSDQTTVINIVQQDNILWLTTHGVSREPGFYEINSSGPGMAKMTIRSQNPCGETLLGPTVDLQAHNSLEEVVRIVSEWFSNPQSRAHDYDANPPTLP